MRRRGRAAALAAAVLLGGAGTAYAAFTTEGSPYQLGGDVDPLNLYAGDLNGDGRPDVITLNGNPSTLSVFLRQPAGGFVQEGQPWAAGNSPSGVALGDYDADGLTDMAVSTFGSGSVIVLRRQTGGGFAYEGQGTSVGETLGGIAAGDFNEDHKLDVAVAEQGDSAVQILLRNSANNGFDFGQGRTVGGGPHSMTAGDFNHDGHVDLAVANTGSASVTPLLGVGDGSFTVQPAVPAGGNPAGIVSGDFNGDGNGDLAVTSFNDSTVHVLISAGDGTFAEQAGSPIAVGTHPVGITLGDFDANGVPDLATADNSGAVDILLGTGSGFVRDTPIAFPTAHQNGVAAADFDGDKRSDLAVSEFDNDTFSVLLNPAPPVPPVPTPTATPPATPTPLPPPVAGKTVTGARKSGTVRFKRPGAKTFTTLAADATIPVGSTVDTRNGRITVTAAQGAGKTASADFFDGLFKLTQTKGAKPATTLALTEPLRCPKAKKASAAAKRKTTRRLWGSGSGRFTTKGSYSAATVRGTEWLVQDTCTTTTTRVKKGVVSVRDNVRHKTVILRAGKRYVAHRKR